MSANFTPLDVETFEKLHAKNGLASILLTLIGILSIIVLSLIAFMLYRLIQSTG